MTALAKQEDRIPLPMPFGWFGVCYSNDLPEKGVKALEYFDSHIALYRGEDGTPRALDAYCVHMGAHLGVGGEVIGNTLACPFHAWQYDDEGKCVHIPYATKIPAAAKEPCLKTWFCAEVNQMIWIWYHPDNVAPLWEPPVYAECNDENWSDFETYDWMIKTHPQEMAENSVDAAHFRYVHKAADYPSDWTSSYDGPLRHAWLEMKMDTPKGSVTGRIENGNDGPGQAWTRFSGICDTFLMASITPVSRELVHTRFAFTQPKADVDGPRGGVAKAFVQEIVRQLNEDIPIWENKKYLHRLRLCDGDGPIMEIRHWFKQFLIDGAP